MATKTLNLKSTGVQFSCGGTIDGGWGDTYINGIEAKSKKNSGKANITVNIPTVMSGINYSKINSIKLSFNCSGWWDRYEQGAMYLGWEEANGTLHLIENGKTIGFYSTPTYHTTGDISIGTCLLSDGRVVFGFYGYNNRVIASNWWYVTNLSIVIDYVESYTLTVTAGTGGTVSGGGTYERGSTATLTATPDNEYYKFKQWSDGNTSNPRTVTVNGNATYTATFTEYGQINTLVNGEGTVTGGGWYEKGSTATLTATPATGYKFDTWNDGLTNNPLTVTVGSGSTIYVASFSKIYYRISTAVSPSGSGTVKGGGEYAHGETATLTATPNSGYKFVKWSDGNTSATRTVTVTGNATYTATFEKLKYTVTWKNHDGTTLETDTNVEYGTTPSYNGATPTKASTAQHIYTFSGWSPTVSAVTGNVTYTAQFTATVRKYTVKWYNYDGTLLETDTDVPYGTKPTYNGATPTKPSDDYYTYGFAGWSPSTEEAIQGDKNFTAQFAQTDRYYTVRWVNASAVQGVEGALLETDTVKFNTQPDYNGATPKHPKQDSDPAFNYDFIGWSAKVTDPAKPDTELEKVKGNITYTAIYETTPKLYAITVILFDSQSTDVYEYGTEVTIEAPEIVDFHQFVKWSDGDTRRSRPITVTGVATYQAVYERIPVPVKVNKEQVTGCYIVPTTKTIVYVISGTVPTVETKRESVDGWSFLVSNSIPENGYPLKKLFITESGVTTRVY